MPKAETRRSMTASPAFSGSALLRGTARAPTTSPRTTPRKQHVPLCLSARSSSANAEGTSGASTAIPMTPLSALGRNPARFDRINRSALRDTFASRRSDRRASDCREMSVDERPDARSARDNAPLVRSRTVRTSSVDMLVEARAHSRPHWCPWSRTRDVDHLHLAGMAILVERSDRSTSLLRARDNVVRLDDQRVGVPMAGAKSTSCTPRWSRKAALDGRQEPGGGAWPGDLTRAAPRAHVGTRAWASCAPGAPRRPQP